VSCAGRRRGITLQYAMTRKARGRSGQHHHVVGFATVFPVRSVRLARPSITTTAWPAVAAYTIKLRLIQEPSGVLFSRLAGELRLENVVSLSEKRKDDKMIT
jgi:hypothetical protein